MDIDLNALVRSIEARAEGERRRRAAIQLPEATTAGGTVFRYIPIHRDRDNGAHDGCPDDFVFVCSCQHVAVVLVEACALSDNAREARMRAIGWELLEGSSIWRCPDCIAVWAIVKPLPQR